jgi:hypothetical protein
MLWTSPRLPCAASERRPSYPHESALHLRWNFTNAYSAGVMVKAASGSAATSTICRCGGAPWRRRVLSWQVRRCSCMDSPDPIADLLKIQVNDTLATRQGSCAQVYDTDASPMNAVPR